MTEVLNNYGVLILRNVPENTEIGIDLRYWRVGRKFLGIKKIPLGFHYFYFNGVNFDCQHGQRIGHTVNFFTPGFIVKKWCEEEEDFSDVTVTPIEEERLLNEFEEYAPYFGPYPTESYNAWLSLSSMVTPLAVTRLMPDCGRIYASTLLQSESSNSQERLAAMSDSTSHTSIDSKADIEQLLPQLKVIPGTSVRFYHIPERPLFPLGSSAAEITACGLDQTFTLDSILRTLQAEYESEGQHQGTSKCVDNLSLSEQLLMAELQFSYLTLLLNHLIDGWHHWRRIVKLLASCEQAISSRPRLYINLIDILTHQLLNLDSGASDTSSLPEVLDLFFAGATHTDPYGSFTEPSFLPTMLRKLLRNILSVGDKNSNEELVKQTETFCQQLAKRFQWSFDANALRREDLVHNSDSTASSMLSSGILMNDIDWDGDEAPLIVEL